MCSRYYFDDDTMNDILNIVEETDASLLGMRVNRDIYPTDDAAVMIRSTDGIKLTGIRWGYPGINGSGGKRIAIIPYYHGYFLSLKERRTCNLGKALISRKALVEKLEDEFFSNCPVNDGRCT